MSADEQVLRLLHDEHAPALWGYAMRLTGGDTGRAQDAVQETLLRAWKHPEVMDSERGSPRPWLFTTLRNVLIDEWRARKVRPEIVTDEVPELASPDHADAAVDALQAVPGRFLLGYGNLQQGPWEWSASKDFRRFVERRLLDLSLIHI